MLPPLHARTQMQRASLYQKGGALSFGTNQHNFINILAYCLFTSILAVLVYVSSIKCYSIILLE